MTKNRPIEPNVLVAFGAAGLLAMLATSGCDGSSSADSNGGSSGTSGASATSNGGSSSGTGASGGIAGDSSGATGGSAGTDTTGGAAGESGGESSGGTSGAMAGKGGTGGAGRGGAGAGPGGSGSGRGGSGGASGAGGSGGGAAGMTGTLGTPCSPRGALACAGNHQKLTILCGGDDTWQPNQTCGNDQFCDSTPGPNVGTCQPVSTGCESGPGTRFCHEDGRQVVLCGPDAITTSTETCPVFCHAGECRADADPCPDPDDYESVRVCSEECAGSMLGQCSLGATGCRFAGTGVTGPAVVRTPWSDDTCACEGENRKRMSVNIDLQAPRFRITVPPPWGIGNCGEVLVSCLITGSSSVFVSTDSEAGPRNVLIESVDTLATCP